MNKQEAIERIKNKDTLNINDRVAGQQVDMVIKNEVLDIISQIDEHQKVVVPKFVAEWIKKISTCTYVTTGFERIRKRANNPVYSKRLDIGQPNYSYRRG